MFIHAVEYIVKRIKVRININIIIINVRQVSLILFIYKKQTIMHGYGTQKDLHYRTLIVLASN